MTVGAVVYQPVAAGAAGVAVAVVTGATSSAGAGFEQLNLALPHTPWAPPMAPSEIGQTFSSRYEAPASGMSIFQVQSR